MAILVSIVIPVKNGEKTIRQCLESIRKQTMFEQTEIIIIDSGSTDTTLAILKEYSFVRLFQIKPENFNHGMTRNFGVSKAKGEFVLLTVQDAELENAKVIERALVHFEDKKVMAVAGKQAVPHHTNTNPHQWYRPVSKPKTEYFWFPDANKFEQLSPIQKRNACALDDVIAFYRKDALLSNPFKKTSFGEDLQWALSAYKLGYAIVFDKGLIAWHYHASNYSYNFKLSIIISYINWKYFNIIPEVRFKVIDILKIIYRNFKYRTHPKWLVDTVAALFSSYKANKEMKKAIMQSEDSVNQLFIKHSKTIPQGKL